MAKRSLQEDTGFGPLVRDVSRLARRQLEKKAARIGLTQPQWLVISHLAHHEGINQATLAQRMDVEPITLVGLIDRLEQAGWVERRLCPDDRRVRLLYLTRQVKPVLDKMKTITTQMHSETFAGISLQNQKRILHILQQVKDNLMGRGEGTEE